MASTSPQQSQSNYIRNCAIFLLIILIPISFYDDFLSPNSLISDDSPKAKQVDQHHESVTDQSLSISITNNSISTNSVPSISTTSNDVTASTLPSIFRSRRYYNTSFLPDTPSLIVSGPPKTGTSTLMVILGAYPDVFAFPLEHFFFASFKHHTMTCAPRLSSSEWTEFATNYRNGNGTLSSLVSNGMIPENMRGKCAVGKLRRNYKGITERKRSYKRPEGDPPKQCINPLDVDQVPEGAMICWFIEKAPGITEVSNFEHVRRT